MEKTAITCDVECYKNYFLVTLYRVSDGATVYFDMHNNNLKPHTLENLRSMLQRYTHIHLKIYAPCYSVILSSHTTAIITTCR